MRVLIIRNGTAGQGRKRRRYARVVNALKETGCQVEEWATTARGDAERLASRIDPDVCDRLVVAGGDGTLNEVVNGLLSGKQQAGSVPLGVLPLGTANVLACEIGLANRSEVIARTICAGSTRPISVGLINERAFVLMAGVGIDSHVVSGVERGRLKRVLGKAAYPAEYVRQLVSFGWHRYTVRTRGATYSAHAVVVSNAKRYAGGFMMAPGGGLGTDTFEMVLFEKGGLYWGVRDAASIVTGTIARNRRVRRVICEDATIEAPSGEPVQVDGDDLARVPARLSIVPRAIDLVVPS